MCCALGASYFGAPYVACGFDYGQGCVYGHELADCMIGCAAPSTAESFVPCCPAGGRCGDPNHCGLRPATTSYGCSYASTCSVTEFQGFPTQCVERNQAGSPDPSCPSHIAARIVENCGAWVGCVSSTTTQLVFPGCRRLDGQCGFDFTEYGLGCIATYLVESNLTALCEPATDAGSGDAAIDGQLSESSTSDATFDALDATAFDVVGD